MTRHYEREGGIKPTPPFTALRSTNLHRFEEEMRFPNGVERAIGLIVDHAERAQQAATAIDADPGLTGKGKEAERRKAVEKLTDDLRATLNRGIGKQLDDEYDRAWQRLNAALAPPTLSDRQLDQSLKGLQLFADHLSDAEQTVIQVHAQRFGLEEGTPSTAELALIGLALRGDRSVVAATLGASETLVHAMQIRPEAIQAARLALGVTIAPEPVADLDAIAEARRLVVWNASRFGDVLKADMGFMLPPPVVPDWETAKLRPMPSAA